MKQLWFMTLTLLSSPSFGNAYFHYSCGIDRPNPQSVTYQGRTLEIIYREREPSAPTAGSKTLTLKVLDSPKREQVGEALVIKTDIESQTIQSISEQEPTLTASGPGLKQFFIHLELKSGRGLTEKSSPDEPEEADYYLPANNFNAWMLSDGLAEGDSRPFSTEGKMKQLECSRVNYYLGG